MKIAFAVSKLVRTEKPSASDGLEVYCNWKTPKKLVPKAQEVTFVGLVYDWEAIKRAEKKGFCVPSRRVYNIINALIRNSQFIAEILEARRKCDIPLNGFAPKEYISDFEGQFAHGSESAMRAKLAEEQARILSQFNLPIALYCWQDLILYGVVDAMTVKDGGIHHHLDRKYNNVVINICESLSKKAVTDYIEDNWEDLKLGMGQLQKILPDDFGTISDRDLEIVDCRDIHKLTFKQIAEDVIAPKYAKDNDQANINQDSVKTAYKRAKKKIDVLFMPKVQSQKGNI